MNWSGRRERFRTVLAGEVCVHPGSVFDPMSARMAEDLGFEIGIFAGSVASMTVLGAPDLILLTLTEFADQAYRINRASNLPLLVDADHGYGNALNVKRTVEELEAAGVAALTIEDTDLPQPYGTVGNQRLLPIEEGVGKIKAALAGRQDKNLVIAGRTSAPRITNIQDAIVRTKAYAAAGIDAMFFAGPSKRSEIEALAAEIKIPIMLGGSSGELSDKEFLGAHGVRIALQGHLPFSAAVNATYEMLRALRDGSPPADIDSVIPTGLLKLLTRDADYQAWMHQYLGQKDLD